MEFGVLTTKVLKEYKAEYISGGNHTGKMAMKQDAGRWAVTSFELTADGAGLCSTIALAGRTAYINSH